MHNANTPDERPTTPAAGGCPGSQSPSRASDQVAEGAHTDFKDRLTYAGYLRLDRLLTAQEPLSRPEHHDEMLFIIQHQTSELWMKLVIHELLEAIRCIRADELERSFKVLARVKHIQTQLTNAWSVLATLTPTEYAQFRGVLANASGFQSAQYRTIEFLMGNKNPGLVTVFEYDPAAHADLTAVLNAPSVYDEFLRHLARRGMPLPSEATERDWTRKREPDPRVVAVLQTIYDDPRAHWDAYEMCEKLVDLEESFQFWRFRHLKTVLRTIGYKRGTGGTAGVNYLEKMTSQIFFQELMDVRTSIGRTD